MNRNNYFNVNDKAMGVSTSYRVSGRAGELGKRFWNFSEASAYAKVLNKAYELGLRHGQEGALKP
jgi:hypothetical protein